MRMNARLRIDLPKSLSAVVEERIRDAIVDGELAFGQALPEDGTGLAMGVSRTPMREALTRLQLQGLVVILPKRGTFVFNPSAEDVAHLAKFRLLLETAAAELCLADRMQASLAGLRMAYDEMGTARRQGDRRAYARADTRFHESLFAHCGNPYLVNAFHTISWRVAALRAHLSVPRAHEQDVSFEEHREMIGCLERRERAPLLRLLKQHIMRAAAVYADALRP